MNFAIKILMKLSAISIYRHFKKDFENHKDMK